MAKNLKIVELVLFGKVFAAIFISLCLLTGCHGYLSSSGPSRSEMGSPDKNPPVRIIDVNDDVARRIMASEKHQLFSETLTTTALPAYSVGPGDVLEVSLWEAPPAMLFGAPGPSGDMHGGTSMTSAAVTFPGQMISADGTIQIPFAGDIIVAGKTPQQIGAEITQRLVGKANKPQVMVRVTQNTTSNVVVMGDVGQSLRMPLTAKGEHVLDAIAAGGGVHQPVSKITVQVTRGDHVQTLPLETVIKQPKENVALAPGDVVTVLFQPSSYTILGAATKNEEINFEAQGISLAQALARAGGVQDLFADARGVFIFRFEDPQALDAQSLKDAPKTPEGKVPVVYRVDLKDPRTFLVAQNFPVRNKDVIYIANAPSAEFQKFMNIIYSTIFSAVNLKTL